MKKNAKVVIGCSIVAAVCFGIVSYGHLPWTDGAWLGVCRFDGRTVGAGGDE